MQHTSTTRLSPLWLICLLASNSCHACTDTLSWLHRVTGIDVGAHMPESGELLKALGLVVGVAIAIRGIQEIEKIIVTSLDQENLEQQDRRLPPTLHERIFYHELSAQDAQDAIEQEYEARTKLILDWQQEKPAKKKKHAERPISSRPVLYDSTDETMKTGCLLLDLKKTTP